MPYYRCARRTTRRLVAHPRAQLSHVCVLASPRRVIDRSRDKQGHQNLVFDERGKPRAWDAFSGRRLEAARGYRRSGSGPPRKMCFGYKWRFVGDTKPHPSDLWEAGKLDDDQQLEEEDEEDDEDDEEEEGRATTRLSACASSTWTRDARSKCGRRHVGGRGARSQEPFGHLHGRTLGHAQRRPSSECGWLSVDIHRERR